jgi:ribosome-associated protein
MQAEQMRQEIYQALVDAKGQDIKVLDVRKVTDFTDYMIIASGTSSRHVQTLAQKVRERLRAHGIKPVGSEGEQVGDWVLIDFGDVVAHLMRPPVRDLYNLEKLWGDGPQVETAVRVSAAKRGGRKGAVNAGR